MLKEEKPNKLEGIEMTNPFADMSQRKAARIAGLLYLTVIVLGIFANLYVRFSLIVPGDAAATANNIMANELLFRLSFVSDLIMALCWFLLGLALYVLLKPVNKKIALLMVLSFLAGVPIIMLNLLNHFAALLLLNGADYLTVFTTDQLHALVLLFLTLHKHGYIIAAIFTSFCLLPLGYLVYKSGYFPRVLGLLLLIGPIFGLIDHFAVFLFPSFADFSILVTLPLIIAEFSTCGWLLLKGAKIPEMKS